MPHFVGGDMGDRNEMRLTIDTDGGPISFVEFSDFILHFRAAYVLTLEVMKDYPSAGQWASAEDFARFIAERKRPISVLGLFGIGRHPTAPDEDLQLLDIRRENPLEWVVTGVVGALTVAVILSGGEIRFPGFRAKLPPLGTGIEALRKSLRGTARAKPLPSAKARSIRKRKGPPSNET
jgi:hypothetical protein